MGGRSEVGVRARACGMSRVLSRAKGALVWICLLPSLSLVFLVPQCDRRILGTGHQSFFVQMQFVLFLVQEKNKAKKEEEKNRQSSRGAMGEGRAVPLSRHP
nr:hypothetical protein [Pandoravirus massiliensis]